MATPSSRAVLRRPIWSDSMSRLKGEYLWMCQSCCGLSRRRRQYVLNLDSIDVLNLAGTPQGFRAALRETKVLDLALVLEFLGVT
jgi:hypothetical protein